MRKRIGMLAATVVLLLVENVLSQTPRRQPRATPTADTGKACRNFPKGKQHPNCYCKKVCDKNGKEVGEDPKCSNSCRKSDCHCERGCSNETT